VSMDSPLIGPIVFNKPADNQRDQYAYHYESKKEYQTVNCFGWYSR
jgi:hypothetical protein